MAGGTLQQMLTMMKLGVQQHLNAFNPKLQSGGVRTVLVRAALLFGLALVVVLLWNTAAQALEVQDYLFWAMVVIGGGVFTAASLFWAMLRRSDPLSPAALRLMGMRPVSIFPLVTVTALFSPPVILIMVAVAGVLAPLAEPATLVPALLLIWLQLTLHLRIGSFLGRLIITSRNVRNLLRFLVALMVALSVLIALRYLFLVPGYRLGREVNNLMLDLSMLPIFSPWYLATAADTGTELVQAALLNACIYTGGLFLFWAALFFWAFRGKLFSGRRSRSVRDLGLFELFPKNRSGVIAARSVRYWFSDPRYWLNFAAVPFAPLLIIVPLALVGVPQWYLLLIPVPLVSLFLGWILHNDLAYDGNAFWFHVSVGVRGRTEIRGRLLPMVVMWFVVTLLGSVLTALYAGDWLTLPVVIGLATAAFGGAAGAGLVTSVRATYLVTKPGENPMTQPANAGRSPFIGQLVSLSIGLSLAALVLVPLLLTGSVSSVSGVGAAASLVLGLILGITSLFIGVRLAAVHYDSRAPELMNFLSR